MKDIFQLLTDAKSKKMMWTPAEVKVWLSSIINTHPDWHIDWDRGDEYWIRIVSDGDVLGFISAEMPIAFFQEVFAKEVVGLTRDGLPFVHTVEDFDFPAFSTTRRQMEDIFGRTLTANVDYGRLSLNDLWWATVH